MQRAFWIPTLVALMAAVPLQAVGSFPVTVVDDRGLEITIEGEPVRIVAVGALYAQILVDLGAADRLVAVAESDGNPPEVAPLPTVGIAGAPSVETILGFDPDLVLGPTDWGGERPALEAAGVTVLSTPWLTSLSSIFDTVTTVGAAVGADEEAILRNGAIAKEILLAELAALGKEPIPAAFLFAPSLTDLPSASGSSAIEHELILRAGGTNVFADLEWSPQVSFEEIIARNPAVIFVPPSQIENVLRSPFLRDVKAVADGRVYGVSASMVASTRVAEAFRLILEGLQGADS